MNGVSEDVEDEDIWKALDEDEGDLEAGGETTKHEEDAVVAPPKPDTSEEVVKVRTLRRPGQPSAEDIRKHKQSFHLPYRA